MPPLCIEAVWVSLVSAGRRAIVEVTYSVIAFVGRGHKLTVTADHTLEAVVLFLDAQLRSATMMKYTPRGPYLAYLLLLQHLRQRNIPVPDSLGTV